MKTVCCKILSKFRRFHKFKREGVSVSVSIKKETPGGNYMFKVNNRNTRTRCSICSKLTIKKPERRQ